ncbi:helix-turn-helix transcriptional regulator [Thermocoleostomius sinensis]|uniref:AraC family transcriptional regulator n=1 Tax=Thermocoleostomius sinensis A174 TaxID=2016057 RepID=A0A9E9C7S5_9CYAN|nr:AraC family transcriptional regulator [Thermocoleostomius sinensis]WAL59538.1 AraC family transcriptional regulator [Thermocoleostomius sinensis A174]
MVPPQFGQGQIRSIFLQGMELLIFQYRLHDDLRVIDEAGGTEWEFGFNISGNRCGKQTGESFIGWGSYEDGGIYETYANDAILKIDINLHTPEQLYQLIGEELENGFSNITELIEASKKSFLGEINLITPAMRLALDQILHCPFIGNTRQIYLTSKCLELIALKLDQLHQENSDTKKNLCSLKPDDIDRIYLARDIITKNVDNPPSLIQLSRQVGLNDFKLKSGFREIFGTTVFGYLHRHRMEKARQLLNDRRLNVKEVAQAVGYANQSRFAAAFRKQFGINPKAYLLRQQSG